MHRFVIDCQFPNRYRQWRWINMFLFNMTYFQIPMSATMFWVAFKPNMEADLSQLLDMFCPANGAVSWTNKTSLCWLGLMVYWGGGERRVEDKICLYVFLNVSPSLPSSWVIYFITKRWVLRNDTPAPLGNNKAITQWLTFSAHFLTSTVTSLDPCSHHR